jgi:hypothetical protein
MPSEIGTPKHPLFLFHRSYWLPNPSHLTTNKHSPLVAEDAFLPVPVEFKPESSLSSSNVEPIFEADRGQVQVSYRVSAYHRTILVAA